jgi:hypothetical protein
MGGGAWRIYVGDQSRLKGRRWRGPRLLEVKLLLLIALGGEAELVL